MSTSSSGDETIFAAALERPAGPARVAYLDAACAGDATRRARLDGLLQAHDEASHLLATSAFAAPLGATAIPAEKPGDRIGRYQLLQPLGEGGCGVVYLAEQQEPVVRRVALKVIKLGMDTREVVARFEAERQALALMNHPNIASVLDGGATERGRPFFVMELVQGVPITKYCDEQNLSTAARLELFTAVCHAVQHAHQKGIIHRDLKPSNILVTLHDGKPVPKVIDFGIAKATQGKLTDATLFTAFEQFIGTPAYMSPEQAELSGLDIDTRSDIYSLGVLLYELLTGRPPFDPKTLVEAGLDEIRRIIREVEPPRPSTSLSPLTASDRATIAKKRGLAPAQLSTLLRGDLDWIVMKSLEKDRTRRYETAGAFAADIVRHLENEPVVACPPSAGYRLGKTIRRNRLAFAAAAAMALALVLGFGLATRAFLHERSARNTAETEANKSAQIARLLQDMLAGVGPVVALGRDPAMLREILDQTDRSLQRGLEQQPEVEIELRDTLGFVYRDLGELEKAESMHREALSLRRLLLGNNHRDVAASLRLVADTLRRRGEFASAELKLREALSIHARLPRGDDRDGALQRDLFAAAAQLYADWARTDPAKASVAAEWKLQRDRLPPADPNRRP